MQWYGAGRDVDWTENSHQLAYCLRGASQGDHDLYVMINAGGDDLTFASAVATATRAESPWHELQVVAPPTTVMTPSTWVASAVPEIVPVVAVSQV